MKQLVILAGGKGTRLKDRLGDLPKPMIPIGGKPLLEHQVELAKKYAFTDLLFFVHYRADLIQEYFGHGEKWGVSIKYLTEPEPLGTAGAVITGFKHLADRFLVMYGDTMVNVDLDRIWRAHEQHNAEATLLLHPNDHPFDSDLVEVDANSRVLAFHNRPHAEGIWRQNLVNAGLYVLDRRALEPFQKWFVTRQPETLLDFGKDLFPALLRQGTNVFGYNSPEYIKDIGTPQRYDRISAEFAAGVIARSSLATPQRAVFLDRDGTLVVDKDCLRSVDGLELLPGVAESLHQLNHNGWRAVVVTNQPVVAKGWCTEAELQNIHNKLETLLGREHAFLDRIYLCPHHPEKGFAGQRTDLKIDCACRKPKTGMIQSAAEDLNIDLKQSWLVGDTTTDLQAAKNAGVKSILVRTGAAGKDGKHDARPDFTFDTLNDAVGFILGQKT
ncbi:MAG TPA: HAD-IIIA family hydrolase [Verrucomicrobiae bacterium]|jgi:D,D-heptose 1,7-bisphosphate phosphatase|nr:HAD-IIIA family hydrolase [Verrucomicrobiae bacterium]